MFQIAALVELFGGVPAELCKSVKAMPPTLILHGAEDTVVPVQEGYALYGRLIDQKQTVEAEFLPGVGHCFFRPGTNEPDCWVAWRALGRTTAFLSKHLKPVADNKTE